MVQLDDWVLCRIYKKASHLPLMAVPPLSDHEQDEPCGFDENPYAATTSAAVLLQGASCPALQAAAGAQRMPRIPSLTELFSDPSLAHLFEEGGMQDMARLGNHHQQHQQQHGALLGRPVTTHEPTAGQQHQQLVRGEDPADGPACLDVGRWPWRSWQAQEVIGGEHY